MQSGSFIGDLFDLTFERFITIKWVKLLFIVGLVFIALLFVVQLLFGLFMLLHQPLAGLLMMLLAAVGAVIQVIGLRITLEIVVVLFRIEENTRGLRGDAPTGGFPVEPITGD